MAQCTLNYGFKKKKKGSIVAQNTDFGLTVSPAFQYIIHVGKFYFITFEATFFFFACAEDFYTSV